MRGSSFSSRAMAPLICPCRDGSTPSVWSRRLRPEAISTSWWSAIAARRALRAHLGADVAAGFSTLRSALLTALGSAPNRSQYF